MAVDEKGRPARSITPLAVDGGLPTGLEKLHLAESERAKLLDEEVLRAAHPVREAWICADRGMAHKIEEAPKDCSTIAGETVEDAVAHERPPSTERIWPEIHSASSLAKKTTALAMSVGLPRRLVWIPATSRS